MTMQHSKTFLSLLALASLAASAFAGEFVATTSDPGVGRFEDSRFRYSFALREGYDSNVFQTNTNVDSSMYTNAAVGVGYAFGSPRLTLDAVVNFGVTYYYTRPGDKIDWTGGLTLGAVYSASPRLQLTLTTYTAYLNQPDYTIVGTPDRQIGDYFYSSTTLGARYLWAPKFATTSRYTFTVVSYVDGFLQDTQGRIEQTFGQSFDFLWLPKTTLVAEYRVNPVTYFSASDLDSLGQFFLLGVDQVFTPRSKLVFRGGAEQRFLNNPTGNESTYFGPFGELALNYRFAPQSDVTLTARYGTEASGLANVNQRQTARFGLNINHGFTARISGNVFLNYSNSEYIQPGIISNFNESVWDTGVGLRYQINRAWSITSGYQFSSCVSQVSIRDYNRSTVFLGLLVNL